MRGSAAIWRLRVALAAALLLLFGTVSGAFAGAGLSASVVLDAYGNPICASHTGNDSGPGHPGLPGCCTLACCALSAGLAGAAPGGDLGPGFEAVIARLPAGSAADVLPAAPDHDPGRPRAPPSA